MLISNEISIFFCTEIPLRRFVLPQTPVSPRGHACRLFKTSGKIIGVGKSALDGDLLYGTEFPVPKQLLGLFDPHHGQIGQRRSAGVLLKAMPKVLKTDTQPGRLSRN